MREFTVFDIETGPNPNATYPAFSEIRAPKNYKDAEKIAKWKASYVKDMKEAAALNAETAVVLAIGIQKWRIKGSGEAVPVDDAMLWHGADECSLLSKFVTSFKATDPDPWVGFNCCGFDVPMLARRGWAKAVPEAGAVVEGRYQSSRFIDVMDIWHVGRKDTSRISLDKLARFLGLGKKIGDGRDFAKTLASDPGVAMKYLENDLKLTALCYSAMTQ